MVYLILILWWVNIFWCYILSFVSFIFLLFWYNRLCYKFIIFMFVLNIFWIEVIIFLNFRMFNFFVNRNYFWILYCLIFVFVIFFFFLKRCEKIWKSLNVISFLLIFLEYVFRVINVIWNEKYVNIGVRC